MASTIPAPLAGKVAVVTGASRGIGEAIVLDFARRGCTHIAITYLTDKAAAESVAASIHGINSSIKTAVIQADVRSASCGKDVVRQALHDLETDKIDIMVSNAGIMDINDNPPPPK